MKNLLVIALLSFVGCQVEPLEGDSGFPETIDLSLMEKISTGEFTWGRIPFSWGAEGCTGATPGAGQTVSVESDGCTFNMKVQSCKCVGAEAAAKQGVLPGIWCYGLVASIPQSEWADCGTAIGPSWPPPTF